MYFDPDKKCPVCSSRIRRGNKTYCSRECIGIAVGRRKKPMERYNCFCHQCGENFTRTKSTYKRAKFCSKECQGRYHARNLIKREGPSGTCATDSTKD